MNSRCLLVKSKSGTDCVLLAWRKEFRGRMWVSFCFSLEYGILCLGRSRGFAVRIASQICGGPVDDGGGIVQISGQGYCSEGYQDYKCWFTGVMLLGWTLFFQEMLESGEKPFVEAFNALISISHFAVSFVWLRYVVSCRTWVFGDMYMLLCFLFLWSRCVVYCMMWVFGTVNFTVGFLFSWLRYVVYCRTWVFVNFHILL